MKQTAVQWLEQELKKGIRGGDAWFELLEQAKELEKQQIVKAVYDSMGTNLDPNIGRAEQYYNETYKNTKE
jgi:hypothetical protein